MDVRRNANVKTEDPVILSVESVFVLKDGLELFAPYRVLLVSSIFFSDRIFIHFLHLTAKL